MDVARRPPRHIEVARQFGAPGQHHHVIIVEDALDRHGGADLHPGAENHALGFHLDNAPVDQRTVHLEVGDAIAQQPADPVGLLEHRRRMPHPRQLLRTGEPRRPRSDHRDPPPGPARRDMRRDPAFIPAAVDNRAFDRLDRHRGIGQRQRARRLARRRTDPAGKFGKVIGPVQPLARRLPLRVADQQVPVGDEIADRTGGVAKRHPAIHAARRLADDIGRGQRQRIFVPVRDPFGDRTVAAILARDREEGGRIAHAASSSTRRYSIGMTSTNSPRLFIQLASNCSATLLPVRR